MPATTPCRILSTIIAAAVVVAPTNEALAAPAPAPTAAPAETPAEEPADAEPAEGEGEPAEAAEPESELPEPEPAPAPAPVSEGPERPPEPQIGGKPAKGVGMMIAGGTLLGVGVASLATSVVLTSCPEPANTTGCKYATHRTFVVPVTAAVTTAGLLLLLVGAGYSSRYKRWQRWTPEQDRGKGKVKVETAAVGPSVWPGGGGVGYVGRF